MWDDDDDDDVHKTYNGFVCICVYIPQVLSNADGV